jgi:hypothetical protein
MMREMMSLLHNTQENKQDAETELGRIGLIVPHFAEPSFYAINNKFGIKIPK